MSDSIYCKYCNKTWETGIRYDKHLRMCEFFYQDRRNPRKEMDERGTPIPNLRELYRYVKHLSNRLEHTEKELAKLRSVVNSKQRRSIIEWLNKPNHTPSTPFEDWVRNIQTSEQDMLKVLNVDLMEGILSSLHSAFDSASSLPIRCFSQKPGTLYAYSSSKPVEPSTEPEKSNPEWKIMSNDQVAKIVNSISKDLRRKYKTWEKANLVVSLDDLEFDQIALDKSVKYMQKLNADMDKRIAEFKKIIFSKLEEDIHVVMECEFE